MTDFTYIVLKSITNDTADPSENKREISIEEFVNLIFSN